MKTSILVFLDKSLRTDMKTLAGQVGLSENEYICNAIASMNSEVKKSDREAKLRRASLLVRSESIKVNREFDEIR